MIGHLHGRLAERTERDAVVDVHGLGLRVQMATDGPLPSPGEPVYIHTSLVVKETALELYGFTLRESRDLFELLLGVTGVGPKVALGLVSTYRPSEVENLIATGDVAGLCRAPSVGRRLAERLVLDLPAKLRKFDVDVNSGRGGPNLAEVVEALEGLGFSRAVAQAAVGVAARELGPTATVDDLVRVSMFEARKAGREDR